MSPFRHIRRFAQRSIPIFGHYMARAAHAVSAHIPSATRYVERALNKGLTWSVAAAQSLNINPTFGDVPAPESARVPRARFMFPWSKYPDEKKDIRTSAQRAYDAARQQKRARVYGDERNVFSWDARRF